MRNWLALLLLVTGLPATASTFGFSLDNDFFLGLDRHYTNGLRLAWLSDARRSDSGCGFATGLCALPGISGSNRHQAWSMALQQMMITPKDITRTTPDYNDLPYVGFTHLDIGFYGWDDRQLTGYGFRLGVVGEDSGAESAQKFIHRMIGSDPPRGWSQQLGPATIGGVYAFQSRQLYRQHLVDGYAWAAHLAYGADVNNFMTAAKVAGFASFGHHMTMRFIPDFTGLSTGAAMVGNTDGESRTGWSVFAGFLTEYDGYSYMERHAPDAYDLDTQRWVANLLVGAAHRWSAWQLIFTLRTSNSLVKHLTAPLTFGNLTVLWSLP